MPLLSAAEPLTTRLLDIVFPPRCAGCGARGRVFCAECLARVEAPEAVRCAGCDQPLPPAPRGPLVGLCARCQARDDVPLAGLRVAARFADPIRAAIHALKYRRQPRLAAPLGDLLAGAGAAIAVAGRASVVVPVPLHPARERQRGFNQSQLLARRCAVRLGLTSRADLLARTRATPPQVGLNAHERHANVSGAFAATRVAADGLSGQTVLLVDDVCTTGATLAAAAAALRAAGAASVWGLAVARPALGMDSLSASVPWMTR